jgi:hypothetical protein
MADNLALAGTVLASCDTPYWLLYGTLLGAIREGKAISYDHDIDIGVFAPLRLSALCALIRAGFNLTRQGWLVTIERQGETIDIYPYAKSRNGYRWMSGPLSGIEITGSHLATFDSVAFENGLYLIPSNSERLLAEWYGDDWRIPKKGCPARCRRFLGEFVKYQVTSFMGWR